MASGWTFITSVLAALGSGVMAGMFFSFSVFIMRALASIPPEHGMSAMRAINVKIITPLFLLVFLGTALVSLILAVGAVQDWANPASPFLLSGSALYLLGVMVVTMAVNVPKNNALGRIVPTDAAARAAWSDYVRSWTAWNHVRSVASFGATACFVLSQFAG